MHSVQEIISQTRLQQKKSVQAFNKTELVEFTKALIQEASAKNFIINPQLQNNALLEKLVHNQIRQLLYPILNQFPEVLDPRLAFDIPTEEFGSIKEKMDGVTRDINNGRIDSSRIAEILSLNYFDDDDETIKGRTFVGQQLPKITKNDLFLILQSALGGKLLGHYLETPNALDHNISVSVLDLYSKDYGYLNEEERGDVTPEMLERIPMRLSQNARNIVNVNRVDTHNVSSHKTGDEAHVTAFKMMLESNPKLQVITEYEAPSKEGDPSRKVNIQNRGGLDNFIQNQLDALYRLVFEMANMNDSELFETYVRYSDIKKYETISYSELKEDELQSFEPKINGWRFQANAALRYINNMQQDHQINSGTYNYSTNTANSCGLTMEEMIATAYWASQDKENFKNPNATSKGAFLSLVSQLYDMRRGYDIDHGTDKPEEWIFPANPGQDNNRCAGGGVNSLSWSLATIHKAYNPKKIERQDIEREIRNIYQEIINNNLEEIAKTDKNVLRIWSSTNKVQNGELKTKLQGIFESRYSKQFEIDYKGYVSDDTFYQILESGLDNIEIPNSLKQQGIDLKDMSTDELYEAITTHNIPLLHFDKETGYDSTINYLHALQDKKSSISDLLQKVKDEENPTYRANALLFLSKSLIKKPY